MILEKEIELIDDERLGNAVFDIIKDREEMLKNYPASTGGKHHPPEERGPGGLVLHIRRMVNLLHEISKHLGLTDLEHDILIFCALTHDISNIDISKQGDDGRIQRDGKMYGLWHGCLSANISTKYLVKEGFLELDETVLIIQGIIRSHMGVWLPNNRQPSSKLEIIFSLVDFIDTRENVHVEV